MPQPRKRLRLYQRIREVGERKEDYVSAGHADSAMGGHSILDHQDASSSEARGAAIVPSQKEGLDADDEDDEGESGDAPVDDGADEREEVFLDDENTPLRTKWNTTHGINSDCASVQVEGMSVIDLTGQERDFFIPISGGLPDRPWTEEEKEDLRVYVQDYKIHDWSLLAQSMNRSEMELVQTYLDVIVARNRLAGRHECAGLPKTYPDLTPPPQLELEKKVPVNSSSTENAENDKLSEAQNEGSGSELEEGEIIEEEEIVEGEIVEEEDSSSQQTLAPAKSETGSPCQKKDLLKTVKNGRVSKKSSRRGADRKAGHQAEVENDGEEPSLEREWTCEQTESLSREKTPVNARVEEEEAAEVKQEGLDPEHRESTPIAPESKKASAKGSLSPKFAGVSKLSKLSGSSRRGVPRHAAGLRD